MHSHVEEHGEFDIEIVNFSVAHIPLGIVGIPVRAGLPTGTMCTRAANTDAHAVVFFVCLTTPLVVLSLRGTDEPSLLSRFSVPVVDTELFPVTKAVHLAEQ